MSSTNIKLFFRFRTDLESSPTLPSTPISESPNTPTNDDGSSKKRPEEGAEKPPITPTERNKSP